MTLDMIPYSEAVWWAQITIKSCLYHDHPITHNQPMRLLNTGLHNTHRKNETPLQFCLHRKIEVVQTSIPKGI